MTAMDSDFGFDAVFRKSAAELRLRLANDAAEAGRPRTLRQPGGLMAFLFCTGFGILSFGIVVIGFSALRSDAPEIWIHRLMALALVQSFLIGAVAMKLLPIIERHRSLAKVGVPVAREKAIEPPRKAPAPRIDPVPPPLPEPQKPVVGGKLSGRQYLEYNDGSIEIDTLVGRRRFVSLDAAREFVGA